MKPGSIFIALALLSLITGCSTTRPDQQRAAADDKRSPETVLITYHVKPGKEEELEQVLADVWVIYRREHLVFAQPHVTARANDGPDKTRFIEIFTWVSHSAPESVPASVNKLWDQMHSLCEPRDGHPNLDGGEGDLVTPRTH